MSDASVVWYHWKAEENSRIRMNEIQWKEKNRCSNEAMYHVRTTKIEIMHKNLDNHDNDIAKKSVTGWEQFYFKAT